MFPALLDAGVPFHVHEIDGYWNDVGTLREYLQGNLDAVSGVVRLPALSGELVDAEGGRVRSARVAAWPTTPRSWAPP